MDKTAEEELGYGEEAAPQQQPVQQPAADPYAVPQCEGDSCQMQEPSSAAPSSESLQEAAAQVSQADAEAVQAAKTLRNMADEYIDSHNNALKKEAEVFGTMFADSFYSEMAEREGFDGYDGSLTKMAEESFNNGYNTAFDYIAGMEFAEDDFDKVAEEGEEDYFFAKLAEDTESAYYYTLQKIAEGEAYAQTMNQIDPQQQQQAAPQQPQPQPAPQQPAPGVGEGGLVATQPEEEPAPEEEAGQEPGVGEGGLVATQNSEPLPTETVAASVLESARAAREAAAASHELVEGMNEGDEEADDTDVPVSDLPTLTDHAYTEAQNQIAEGQAQDHANAAYQQTLSQNAYDNAMSQMDQQQQQQ